MNHLKSMTIPEIGVILKELGQPAFRAKQVYSWLHKGVRSYEEMTNLPKALRDTLQEKYPILVSTLLGGLILGVMGTLLPLTMFSGEHEIHTLMETYLDLAPWLLILTGGAKLLLTCVCIQSGWRGGHFFPVIFCGIRLSIRI